MTKRTWIQQEIDFAIKSVWCEEISRDYNDHKLLKEDSLKNAFYHHLRNRLDNLCDQENIRIFTEFNELGIKKYQKRADLAIVQLKQNPDAGYLGDDIAFAYAIIEFKYDSDENYIMQDIPKLKLYKSMPSLSGCQYYLGFLSEKYYDDDIYWMDGRQTANWADGCTTELISHWDTASDEAVFYFRSYNGMNQRLERQ